MYLLELPDGTSVRFDLLSTFTVLDADGKEIDRFTATVGRGLRGGSVHQARNVAYRYLVKHQRELCIEQLPPMREVRERRKNVTPKP